MKIIFFFLMNSISISLIYSQDIKQTFNYALKLSFRDYKNKSDLAFERGDLNQGKILFDSLVSSNLIGTYFDDYNLRTVSNKDISLKSFEKPVFMLTYASWCIPSKGEIPALNTLADSYSDKIQFVILFWDKKENIKKLIPNFNKKITICYANEYYKNDSKIIATLKHTFGLPTCYFLDKDLKVKDIRRIGPQPNLTNTEEFAFNLNYSNFSKGISCLIDSNNNSIGYIR